MVRDACRVPSRSDVKPLSPKMDQSKLKLHVESVGKAGFLKFWKFFLFITQ